MARETFVVTDRRDFDVFWLLGRQFVMSSASASPTEAVSRGPIDNPPVTQQVWWEYANRPLDEWVDLLVEPGELSADRAVRLIRRRIMDGAVSLETTRIAAAFDYIAIKLRYQDLVHRLLPLTRWRNLLSEATESSRTERLAAMRTFADTDLTNTDTWLLGWFLHLLLICGFRTDAGQPAAVTYGEKSAALGRLDELLIPAVYPDQIDILGRVTFNRPVSASVARSGKTIKADATRELFNISCAEIRWAVVDSGIDARHVAFRRTDPETGEPFTFPFENEVDGQLTTFNFTRILGAFDFTRHRTSGALEERDKRHGREQRVTLPGDVPLFLDGGLRFYEPPANGHGTHVAGIVGGRDGICPDIKLYDFRVLDEEGNGNEFVTVAALRYILDLNRKYREANSTGRNRDLEIHGVNLSLSVDADVSSDACGWSLVCRVADELVRSGVVVVVSAGNTGFEDRSGGRLISSGQSFRSISITDPGNTERVVTVGSTNPDRPKEYGVSYFSARGPTADGRAKPDLVAPGEDISAAYGFERSDGTNRTDVNTVMSGTSQAAAHVSGCAALLLARHRELIGKPDEVKRILLATATDLERDRTFQGTGLVDALRATQYV